ncbi:zinc finger (c2h2 type) domain-containing protein [Cyclospora cayetanensis]|uniref:Zinc finger (C2h2 type) domain-containing protein n=1 Tax=Cyclospora cayetanensis TaxID=88456 RepID=A0A1D3D3Z6_9EIME|nr:zinc finger (c2h2 type) domain-containing protein [Cyclospora cayetanensis]
MSLKQPVTQVLQIDAVFQNVSKGELARKAELLRYFGTDDRRTCILKILEKGELQVSELERRQQLESHFNDIVSLVIDLTYSAVTGLPLSRSAVSGALKDLGFAVRLQQPPKAQALHAALLLQHHNPGQIRRRLMRLKMQLPGAAAAAAASMLHYIVRECAGIIETQDPTVDVLLQRQQQDVSSAAAATEWLVVFLVPPGAYREVEEKVQEAGGSLSVVAWNCLHGTQKEQQLQLKMEQDQLQQQLDELRQQQAQLQQDLEVESQRRLQQHQEESTTTAFPEASPSASTAQQQEQRGPRCRVCGDMFKDVVELRVHCKSSRHATNLRRQADKLPPLADAEWNELQLDKHLMAGVPTEVRGF